MYQEIPVERDGDVVRIPSLTIVNRPLDDLLEIQHQFNETHNILAAFMLRDMLTTCANCGEACLKTWESSLCQECVMWPSVVYENVLDADLIG